jgi:cell division protein ZapA
MKQIEVTIMGQIYKLACKEGEQDALRQAAMYLDEKMCALRDSTKLKGDKIAVMAALTIAAELFSTKAPDGPFAESSLADFNHQIHSMNKTLDNALNPQETLYFK